MSRALASIIVETPTDSLAKKGLLLVDPRSVERKKPGQKKARKKFAWYAVFLIGASVVDY